MHQKWWDGDANERARRAKEDADRLFNELHKQPKPPPGFEYDEPKTSQTTMELINVCLDDWKWLAGEVDALTREAQALHIIERDQDIEF